MNDLPFSVQMVDYSLQKYASNVVELRNRYEVVQRKADLYAHLIPEWPALSQSFQRDADRLEKAILSQEPMWEKSKKARRVKLQTIPRNNE